MGNDSHALLYGYLHKLNQSGVWQRRFFETDGEFLTYYKSKKRKKLLATLDLIKVGDISVNMDDSTGCTFQIQVAGRPYFLRAENNGTCEDWVINLNRMREARIQLGGMKLVAPQPTFQPDPQADERDTVDRKRSESSTEMIARVTVEATRARTKRVNDIADYFHRTQINKENAEGHTGHRQVVVAQDLLAKWQKRKSNFRMMRSRLAKFVRWMRIIRILGKQHDVVVLTPVPDSTQHTVSYYSFINIISIFIVHHLTIIIRIQMAFTVEDMKTEQPRTHNYRLVKRHSQFQILRQ